jgi:hypothetical protein
MKTARLRRNTTKHGTDLIHYDILNIQGNVSSCRKQALKPYGNWEFELCNSDQNSLWSIY